jgi:phosphoesterase RecJ-like protein
MVNFMALEKLKKIIREDDNFLISSHINPDGDSIGGMLAMGWLLDKLSKRNAIVIDSAPSEKFNYLSGFERILKYSDELRLSFEPKNLIVIDAPNLERMERVNLLLPKNITTINIDHHKSNSSFGDINYIDFNAGASTEIIYDLILSFGMPLDKDAAEDIYTGIIIDTGRFRFPNTTPKTFGIASKLLEAGARTSFIAEWLHHTNSLETIKGLGVLLNSLEINMDGRIAFVHFDSSYLNGKDGVKMETEGFVNYPLSIEGVEVAVLLQESENGKIRVSLRSKDKINVNDIAGAFGGGGHAKAAGCRIKGTIPEAKRLLLQEISKKLN